MAEQYDNTNSGALFAPRTEKILRAGPVDIDGTEYRMVIVQSTIPDKQTGGEKQIFETYLKVGNMFQTEKKSDKDSDYDGKLNFPVGDKKVWFRSKVSNQGNKFTAVSMAPLKMNGTSGSSPALSTTAASSASEVMDDDIPF